MSQGNNINVNSLFTAAAGQATISPQAFDILTSGGIGQQIQQAMGIAAEDVDSSEVFLLSILADDSSSIHDCDNEQHVRAGINLVLDSLRDSKSENDILVLVQTLNKGVLFAYQAIGTSPRIDNGNFRAYGNTPLYDKSIEILGAVLAKEREFADQGVPVRTATLIVSDGADYGSLRRANDVQVVVKDMLRRENHIVAAMGISDGHTDFEQVFSQMGVNPRWILTPSNDPHSIRQAFQVFSNSAKQASQGAQAFSQSSGLGLSVRP